MAIIDVERDDEVEDIPSYVCHTCTHTYIYTYSNNHESDQQVIVEGELLVVSSQPQGPPGVDEVGYDPVEKDCVQYHLNHSRNGSIFIETFEGGLQHK